jgi:hypothetical protein
MKNTEYHLAYETLSEITAKAINELATTNPHLAGLVSLIDDAITEHCCNTDFDEFASRYLEIED